LVKLDLKISKVPEYVEACVPCEICKIEATGKQIPNKHGVIVDLPAFFENNGTLMQ